VSVWRSVTNAAGVRVLVLGGTGLLGIVSSRLILQNFGVAAYAQYGLLAGLRNLIPFADLGVGAVVLNSVSESDDPAKDERVRTTLTTALRVLIVAGLALSVLVIGLYFLGVWPAILGAGLLPGGELAATACLVVFALGLPLGIGSRILVGLGRNAQQIAILGLVSPLFVLGVIAMVVFGFGNANWIPVISYLAAAVTAVLCLIYGSRLISPAATEAMARVPRTKQFPGVPIARTAGPALVISIATPLAMQTDRLFLSHLTSTQELANYGFASLIFGMVLQAIIAAGLSLWPYFAKSRSQDRVDSPFALSAWFFVAAAVACAALVLALPILTRIITKDLLNIDWVLAAGFIALVLVQAVNYPIGMYMTTPRALRFQVGPVLAMATLNIGLTWLFVLNLGSGGAVLATAISVLVCQVVPCAWWTRRDLAHRRGQLAK